MEVAWTPFALEGQVRTAAAARLRLPTVGLLSGTSFCHVCGKKRRSGTSSGSLSKRSGFRQTVFNLIGFKGSDVAVLCRILTVRSVEQAVGGVGVFVGNVGVDVGNIGVDVGNVGGVVGGSGFGNVNEAGT